MREDVLVCEVGPRDGLQMARAIMPTHSKLEWIRALSHAGVSEIEVGSFVPPHLIPQMADTIDVVPASLEIAGLSVVALVPNLRGAEFAYKTGAHAITIPISVSEGHSLANTRKGTIDQINVFRSIVKWVRAQARFMRIDAVAATAFGCSIDGEISSSRVVEVATALAVAGADTIVLADTVGYANPKQIRRVIKAVRDVVGAKLQKLHLHDTMGLGLANALAGLEEGIRAFDTSLAGLGGCPFAPGAAGNIATEDLVFMLHSMGMETGIDLDQLLKSREFLCSALPNQPVFGHLAKAGIPSTYRASLGFEPLLARSAESQDS